MTNTLLALIAGYLLGQFLRDRKYEALYQAQRKRGDQWFSRYLQVCHILEQHNIYPPAQDPPNHYEE